MSVLLDIPLFPLPTVLFPETYLPMRIFEPRYLALIKQCQKDETGFGVIALKEGDEVKKDEDKNNLKLHRIGTLASVVKVQEVNAGLLSIWIKGTARFRLEAHWEEENGLEIGQVSFLTTNSSSPIDPSEDEEAVELYLTLINQTTTDEIKIDELTEEIVCNTLVSSMVIPVAIKQKILEIDDVRSRLDFVNDLLRTLRTY